MPRLSDRTLKVLDILAAIGVLIAIFFAKENPQFWLLYAVGCVAFAAIGYYQKLTGLFLLNVVAAVIGLKNFFF